MKLYNTLTRNLDPISPLKDNLIKLYSCGPTVYDYAHIGNLRKFIFDDMLRRVLTASGFKVKHVMNITDVGHLVSDADEGEDKLEKGASREGRAVQEVAEHYTEAFKKDVVALNILPPNGYDGRPDGYARATDFIDAQIKIIQLLLEKGFAYQTEQAIYFDVTRLKTYGRLSGQKLADKEVAAREEVVTDPTKKHPYDFALWFFTVGHFAHHVLRWPSPWGEGFPGWHLECSAIIHEVLGDPIDIHTGGIDHIGTHHTNEMAQTEAAFGHELAKVWAHSEFILVDGSKMAKSKGNFYTLKDITDRGFSPLAYRLLVLQAHYKSQLNFTWESLEAASNRLRAYQAMADVRWQPQANGVELDMLTHYQETILQHLKNDLDTPMALTALSELADMIEEKGFIHPDSVEMFTDFLTFVDSTLGLNLLSSSDISAAQKQLIQERELARAQKDWNTSDALRTQLQAQGIGLRDTADGAIWQRL
jgi:cysteinyl-tRNA synthetase